MMLYDISMWYGYFVTRFDKKTKFSLSMQILSHILRLLNSKFSLLTNLYVCRK
ncbi:hypothetical protein SPHINGO8BC_60738 [Sphingobacterium multivorum]|uniref:Uncharacterized protein n=1 Tax=Sphingobacterium multivorum TaxID=28454 RepID=A0A654DKM5_SPHMU|nr:hypothetical protein SPHINGO8BC_60738 [Sphingobacterium multivorum]